jgi:hypothetical protein
MSNLIVRTWAHLVSGSIRKKGVRAT